MVAVWNDEDVETLKRLVAEGATTSQIGRAIGVSRCAVAGKAARLGLSIGNGTPRPRIATTKPTAQKKPVPEDVAPVEPHVTVMKLTRQTCRFPIGDPQDADFHFCGHPPENERVYCPTHWRRAHAAC